MNTFRLLSIFVLSLFIYSLSWAAHSDEWPYRDLMNSRIYAMKPADRAPTVRSLIAHAKSLEDENDPKELVRQWIERGECTLPTNGKDHMKADLIGVAAKVISIRNGERKKALAQAAQASSSSLAELEDAKESKKKGKGRQKHHG